MTFGYQTRTEKKKKQNSKNPLPKITYQTVVQTIISPSFHPLALMLSPPLLPSVTKVDAFFKMALLDVKQNKDRT